MGTLSYSKSEILDAAADLRNAAAWLALHGHFALTVRNPDPASNLLHNAGPTGNVSDPTGNLAAARYPRDRQLELEQAHLAADIGSALDAAQGIAKRIGHIVSRFPPPERPTEDPLLCRQDGCYRPKGTRSQGNCDWCAQWLYRHPDPQGQRRAYVPREEIEARDRREADRKRREIEAAQLLFDLLAGTTAAHPAPTPGRA